jgi:hypothetical protein
MRTLTVFCKQTTCPSSETLLSYQAQGRASEQAQWITEHLCSCEFCGAELKLLSEHFQVADEDCPTTVIPAHLRTLAEALLGSTELSGIVSFSEITVERERLTLTDA